MDFYRHTKFERKQIADKIHDDILDDINHRTSTKIVEHFSNTDTYIRKFAYQSAGNLIKIHPEKLDNLLELFDELITHDYFRVRQTVINAAGEIGKKNFEAVKHYFEAGLTDQHHSPRNAVIGSIKKMGERNPVPVLEWAKQYLHHPDKEIRREICHGIELRGRTHPQDILPLLKELQHDKTARVRSTLVHVLGQIAYKKGCLQIVVKHLKTWENTSLVKDALREIIDVHDRYKNFSALTQKQAKDFIRKKMK